MASIYEKDGMVYLGWYDSFQGRRRNKSLRMKWNEANKKKAVPIKEAFEKTLRNEVKKFKDSGIKRITIDKAFNHFLENNSGKHPKTIKDYHRFFNKFIESFNKEDQCTVISKLSVEAWLNTIKRLPQQKNSIFGYYKQLSHFLNFLFEYSYVQMFKINKDVKPKHEIKEKIVFSDKDAEVIFSKLNNKNLNFQCLIYLAYYTGLRSSDLLTITAERINLTKKEISYYSPKRKKFRTIGMHDDLIPILLKRISEVRAGKILNYSNVENINKAVSRYLDAIHLSGKGYTARTFRKNFITHARSLGMDATIVAELVGHEHRSTSDRYYNNITTRTMHEELKKFKRQTYSEPDSEVHFEVHL